MRGVWPHDQDEERAFAEEAAEHFAKNPAHFTSGGDLKPGGWLAIRWGLDNDGVVVLRISEDHEPTNFYGLVGKYADRPQMRVGELIEALAAWNAWSAWDEAGMHQRAQRLTEVALWKALRIGSLPERVDEERS